MGPASRTPNAQLSQVIDAGITTLVGLLGTDSVTRTLQVRIGTNCVSFILQLKFSYISLYMFGIELVTNSVRPGTRGSDYVYVHRIVSCAGNYSDRIH
jgi:beta-aspartyl-dipeptidase (metallo-type)